jgi:hypothetical protein
VQDGQRLGEDGLGLFRRLDPPDRRPGEPVGIIDEEEAGAGRVQQVPRLDGDLRADAGRFAHGDCEGCLAHAWHVVPAVLAANPQE